VPEKRLLLGRCRNENWVRSYLEDFEGRKQKNTNRWHYPRSLEISACLSLLIYLKSGYAIPGVTASQLLNQGCELWREFFLGKWWKADKDSRRALDKSYTRKSLHWYNVYIQGLLIAVVNGQYDVIMEVSQLLTLDIVPEYMGNHFDYTISDTVKIIAHELSAKKKTKVFEQYEKNHTYHYGPVSRLVHPAWVGIRSQDSKVFNRYLRIGIRRLASKARGIVTAIENIDVLFSILANFAMDKDMVLELHGQRVLISMKSQHFHEEVGVVGTAAHFAADAVVGGMAFQHRHGEAAEPA
jgi:hypothetical protein